MDTPIVAKDVLTEVIRRGASRLLSAALEAEVEAYVERFAAERDEAGHRLVVRNGHARLREIQTGVGDGALGFWKALPKVFPTTREQRCWVHKMANVLNVLPKGQQPEAKRRLQAIWMAATRQEAFHAFDLFGQMYGAKYPGAVERLTKDRAALLAFYDFPAEHWLHIRTTNPIESTFATVRLRTNRTKGCGSRLATLTMVFMLARAAERRWRRLTGSKLLADVILGVRLVDGIKAAA